MLHFNIRRILDMRGIEHPYTFLVKNGFVPQTATNMVNNYVGHVKPKQIERLCLLLNCTPNDLFDWRPDKNSVVPDTHALRSLTRTQKAKSVADLARDIPADKLEKLGEMLAELKASSENQDDE